jgi:AcrR family transcriptional regulator
LRHASPRRRETIHESRRRGLTFESQSQRRGERRPQERLANLLAAAGDAFAHRGYTHAQVQEICREAGISVGTFYQHFPNKGDLLLHLIELEFEAIPALDVTSVLHLERQLCDYLARPATNIWRAWREAVLADPDLADAGIRLQEQQAARLESWVAAVRAARKITSPELDDATVTWLVLAALRELAASPCGRPPDRVASVARAVWSLVVSSRASLPT